MGKVTIKDLPISVKFKVTGKRLNSLAKQSLQKYKNGCKKVLNSVRQTYDNVKDKVLPNEEQIEIEKQNQISKKEDKIDVKRNELKQFIGQMEQDDEYRIGVKNCYLKEVKVKLKKLDKKRMQVSKKGLGVFALTKLTLSNMKNNIKNKWAKYKEEKNEVKRQKEIEENKKRLAENLKEQLILQNEARNIIEQNPELNMFFNELIKTQDNQNEQTVGRKL